MKCNKCGSSETYTESKSIHVGLYCKRCKAWIKWVSKCSVCNFYIDNGEGYSCNFDHEYDLKSDINVDCNNIKNT